MFLAQVESTTCSVEALSVLTLMAGIADAINKSDDVPRWVQNLIKQLPMLLRTGVDEDNAILWAAKMIACYNNGTGLSEDNVTVMDVLEAEEQSEDFVLSRQMVIGPWRGVNDFREVKAIAACLVPYRKQRHVF
jgi:hypothetical protein